MTSPAQRLRRLSRLVALARVEAREAEMALAAALARLEAAARRHGQVGGLIAGTSARGGPAPAVSLAAAAQLRRLLQPVADAAGADRAGAAAERSRAEAKLAAARQRIRRLEDLSTDARRRAALAQERRTLDAQLPPAPASHRPGPQRTPDP
jgi:hypothetical protein